MVVAGPDITKIDSDLPNKKIQPFKSIAAERDTRYMDDMQPVLP